MEEDKVQEVPAENIEFKEHFKERIEKNWERVICIYNSENLDSLCAAAVVKMRFHQAEMHNVKKDGDFFSMDGNIKLDNVDREKILFFVIFSISLIELQKMSEDGLTVWIDNKEPDIKKFAEDVKNIELGVNDLNLSNLIALTNPNAGCSEIAWEYLFPRASSSPMVSAIGSWESYRNEDKKDWEEIIVPIQYAMRVWNYNRLKMHEGSKVSEFVGVIEKSQSDYSYFMNMLFMGKNIIGYQVGLNFDKCKGAYETLFEGYAAIVVNSDRMSLEAFKSVYVEARHELMINYYFSGKDWTVSLYASKEMNVEAIAKKYEAVGNSRAMIFKTKLLPRELLGDFKEMPLPSDLVR